MSANEDAKEQEERPSFLKKRSKKLFQFGRGGRQIRVVLGIKRVLVFFGEVRACRPGL
jgi:hypothetical protein